MKKQYTHGEVLFFETDSIPNNAKKINVREKFFVVGESETHGNDHRVSVMEDTFIYEKNGVFYIKNEQPMEVYCPKKDRHSTIIIEPGIWEVDKSKEYDYLNQEIQNVRD